MPENGGENLAATAISSFLRATNVLFMRLSGLPVITAVHPD